MWRIVRGAALAAGTTLVVAGCGTEGPVSAVTPEASMTAAVLSEQDLPDGYLPAEDQEVFGGMRPADPDCAELLALADARGLRDMPQASAVFYRADPGASLAQRVLRLPPGGAARYIADTERASRSCSLIKIKVGDRQLRLRRAALDAPAAEDAFAVRYASESRKAGLDLYFDVIMARIGDDLVVLGHPGAANGKNRVTEKVAAKALNKLRDVPITVTTSPKGNPVPKG